jgi:uncharacterized protein (DUF4415 family)
MASTARKKKDVGQQPATVPLGAVTPEEDATHTADEKTVGPIRVEAGPAFSPATRLRVRGLNVVAHSEPQDKEKVSITLDKWLVDELRAHLGGRALSTSINELLYVALAQERLAELVDEMEREAGPPSADSYERVMAKWFAED